MKRLVIALMLVASFVLGQHYAPRATTIGWSTADFTGYPKQDHKQGEPFVAYDSIANEFVSCNGLKGNP